MPDTSSPEKSFFSLNPIAAFRAYRRVREEMRLLGLMDIEQREITAEDEADINRMRATIIGIKKSFYIQLAALLGLMLGGKLLVSELNTPSQTQPEREIPTNPVTNLGEFLDIEARAQSRTQLSDEEWKKRREAVNNNIVNLALLYDQDPFWTHILQKWIEKFREEKLGTSYAETLFDFYKKRGKPMFLDRQGQKIAAIKDHQDFRIDAFDFSHENNQNHKWQQKHGLCYYEAHSGTLFIVQPLTHLYPSPAFKKSRTAVVTFYELQGMDMWLALNDAYLDKTEGGRDLADPRSNQINPVLKYGVSGLEPIITIVTELLKKKKEKITMPKTLSLLMASAETYVGNLAKEINAELSPGEQISIDNPAWDLVAEGMAYRIARLLLTTQDPGLKPLLPFLEELVRNPTLITAQP